MSIFLRLCVFLHHDFGGEVASFSVLSLFIFCLCLCVCVCARGLLHSHNLFLGEADWGEYMRVYTYHRHSIQRTSPLLGALVTLNVTYTFCFALPVVAASLWMRWDSGITITKQTWCVCLAVLWIIIEPFRLFLGSVSNQQQNVPGLLRFTVLTLIPQLPFAILYNIAWPNRDSLDNALSVTMIILLVAELFCSIRLLVTLMQNNQIDFFVYGRRFI